MKFRATQSAPASSTKTASSRLSRLKIEKLWVGATTWTRWRRCPHLPSVLSLTVDSQGGAVVQVCGDEQDRSDHDQCGGSEWPTSLGNMTAEGIGSSSRPGVAQRGGGSQCSSCLVLRPIGQMSTQASHSMHSWPVKTVCTSQFVRAPQPPPAAQSIAWELEVRKSYDQLGAALGVVDLTDQTPRGGTVIRAQTEAVDFFAFDNSYARLPDRFFRAASAHSRRRAPSSPAEQETRLASQARSGKACRTGGCGRGVTRRLPYQSGKRVVVIHAHKGDTLCSVLTSPTHASPMARLSARTISRLARFKRISHLESPQLVSESRPPRPRRQPPTPSPPWPGGRCHWRSLPSENPSGSCAQRKPDWHSGCQRKDRAYSFRG